MTFSPTITPGALAQAADLLASRGHVRIGHILADADAQAIHRFMEREAIWSRLITVGDEVRDLDPAEIARLDGTPEGDEMMRALTARARDRFQFLYDSVRVSDDPVERDARGLPVDHLLAALNGEEWLALFRRLTGREEIAMVDGQATRYLPGHFLTAHTDDVDGKNRVAAYVLGFTPRWRTDWGGLLTFLQPDGDLARAFMPRFNVLNIFTVPQWHSVSQVATFAGAPRYSITGWLRSAG